MRLQDRLPRSVTVDGRRYRVDLDFRNVLKMMDVLARTDLMGGARAYLALKCLMRRPPRNAAPVLDALRPILFPETRRSADGQKLTDFKQDAALIRAAFLQAYGINLWRDRLHWLEFADLLAGIPEGSRYSDVLGIRARPMPQATKHNAKEREWLMQAKARCALQMDDNEREANYSRCVQNVFAGLLAMARKGET